MEILNPSTGQTLCGPVCPKCATRYDVASYNHFEDHARCRNCGTHYYVPDSYRPSHAEDFLEFGALTPAQAAALEQFRDDVATIAEAAARATNNAPYDLYAEAFTEICEPYLNGLDPALREHGVTIASYHGYITPMQGNEACLEPDLCPVTGTNEHHCNCGRHP